MTEKNALKFDHLWDIHADWFEPPNERRGGWSGVIRYTLQTANGLRNVFIKRQENHTSKTLLHPIKGIPTFQKEYRNIQRLASSHVPTLEPIFFGVKDNRAILITKELEGYCSLEHINLSQLSKKDKQALLKEIAIIIAQMHQRHFQHNALYPKHIFVKQKKSSWSIKIIDLEKMKRTLFHFQAMYRDLSTLDRHAGQVWTIHDRLYFLKAYLGENKLSSKGKKLWHKLSCKDKHKRR